MGNMSSSNTIDAVFPLITFQIYLHREHKKFIRSNFKAQHSLITCFKRYTHIIMDLGLRSQKVLSHLLVL